MFFFARTPPTHKKNNNNNLGCGGQIGWDLGFPALHRHHPGNRKKGYPKRQALWKLTLALGRVLIDVLFLFCFRAFGKLGEMCSVHCALVFERLFPRGYFAASNLLNLRVHSPQTKNNSNNDMESGGQRGWDWGFPALHRHQSGTGRKGTRNGKRVVTNTTSCTESEFGAWKGV